MNHPRGGFGDLYGTAMSDDGSFDQWQAATCQSEINSRVLEQCCHCALWCEWSRSRAWPIPQPRGRSPRCCHAGSLTLQLHVPASSCCGSVALSPHQRDVEQLSAKWRVPKMTVPMGRAAKNLGNKVKLRLCAPHVL